MFNYRVSDFKHWRNKNLSLSVVKLSLVPCPDLFDSSISHNRHRKYALLWCPDSLKTDFFCSLTVGHLACQKCTIFFCFLLFCFTESLFWFGLHLNFCVHCCYLRASVGIGMAILPLEGIYPQIKRVKVLFKTKTNNIPLICNSTFQTGRQCL